MKSTKKNSFIIKLLFLICFTYSQNPLIIEPGLNQTNLLNYVKQNYTPTNILSYDNARDIIFSEIDNFNDTISCVYSGYSISLIGGYCSCENENTDCNSNSNQTDCNFNNGIWIEEPDPSIEAYYKNINIEHTWPQSMGAEYGNPKSDMHHLYPTKSNINSSRGNDPFSDIQDENTHKWYRKSEILFDVPDQNIDEYSEKYNPDNQPNLERFEPKEDHKGNVARAMFYFFSIYNEFANVDFWNIQKSTLLNWHYNDPVDFAEDFRSNLISEYQDNISNPFIIDSTLARRIWFFDESINNPNVSFNTNQISLIESDTIINLSVGYNNFNLTENLIIQVRSNDSISHLNDYNISQTEFEFLPNSSYSQDFFITINNDEIYEGFEQFVIEIEIISAPNNIEIDNNTTFVLNIHEDDFPKLTITEVMINPQNSTDLNGEWFEVYVNNEIPINFKNWKIKDNDIDEYLITDNYQVGNNNHAVFSSNSDPNLNGGITNSFQYEEVLLANTNDEIYLISPEGIIADSIWWDNISFPYGNGRSMSLIDYESDNSLSTNWLESNIQYGFGDYGTPGLTNCFSPNFFNDCYECVNSSQPCDFVMGDTNMDETVNVVDIVIIIGFILGDNELNNDQIFVSDINQDSILNIVDIVQIITLILSE